MYLHANAKLGLAGRVALVGVIERGTSLRLAAARPPSLFVTIEFAAAGATIEAIAPRPVESCP